MATLTAQTKLSVSDITADTISLDVTMSPTVAAGGITSKTLKTARNTGTALVLVEAAHYAAGTVVYLRNMSTTETVDIELTAGTTHIQLSPLQWAIFPWEAATDIKAFGTTVTADPTVEIGIFSSL
jgi:hypothetical protein